MPGPILIFGSRSSMAADQRIGHVAHRDDHRDRHAALAGGAVRGGDGGIGGHLDVGVRQHDHVVLRATQRLDALAVRGSGLVDVLRDRGRADEADGRDVGVLEDAVDRDLVAVDDVEDAVRQPRLLQQLTEIDRCGRVLLGRLEDERVPAGDGVGEHPHRHHRREVEWRDACCHAERLADLVHVDAAGDLLAEAALEQVRDAGRELEVLEAAGDLAERIGPDLSVLPGQVRRDLLAMLLDQVSDAEEDLGALADAGGAPSRERLMGDLDGGIDLIGRCEVDLSRDLAGGRVVDRSAAATRARDPLPVDPVVDPLQPGLVAPLGGRRLRDVRHVLLDCVRGVSSSHPTILPMPTRLTYRGWVETPERPCELCDDPIDADQAWMEAADGSAAVAHAGCVYSDGAEPTHRDRWVPADA